MATESNAMLGISSSARIALVCWSAVGTLVAAQQVNTQTPLLNNSSSYYEHFNVGWRYQRQSPRGSMFFEFNSPAFPPFGGYNPNADARFGAAQRWGNAGFSFQFTAGQGSTRTTVMSAPNVTSMNGLPASFQDVTIRPFVTGLIPVVGGFQMFPVPTFESAPPTLISPLAGKVEALRSQSPRPQILRRPRDSNLEIGDLEGAVNAPIRSSTAARGDISVDEIRRQQSEEELANQQEIDRLCAEARIAEVAGQLGVARVRYQQAAARTKGPQREKLLAAAKKLKAGGDELP
jgi:hypothetical protein